MNPASKFHTPLFAVFILWVAMGGFPSAILPDDAEANQSQITQVLNDMFEALREGDTTTLRHLFAGEMYQKYKVLLENNEGYPDFLRTYYKGAAFEITKVVPHSDGFLAKFSIIHQTGKKEDVEILLARKVVATDNMHDNFLVPEGSTKDWSIINQVGE